MIRLLPGGPEEPDKWTAVRAQDKRFPLAIIHCPECQRRIHIDGESLFGAHPGVEILCDKCSFSDFMVLLEWKDTVDIDQNVPPSLGNWSYGR